MKRVPSRGFDEANICLSFNKFHPTHNLYTKSITLNTNITQLSSYLIPRIVLAANNCCDANTHLPQSPFILDHMMSNRKKTMWEDSGC